MGRTFSFPTLDAGSVYCRNIEEPTAVGCEEGWLMKDCCEDGCDCCEDGMICGGCISIESCAVGCRAAGGAGAPIASWLASDIGRGARGQHWVREARGEFYAQQDVIKSAPNLGAIRRSAGKVKRGRSKLRPGGEGR